MSVSYEIPGVVFQMQDTTEARLQLSELRAELGEIQCTEDSPREGVLQVYLNGSDLFSASAAMRIEDRIFCLSPWILHAVKVVTYCADEEAVLWLGPPEEVQKAQTEEARHNAYEAMKKLTPEDQKTVFEILQAEDAAKKKVEEFFGVRS